MDESFNQVYIQCGVGRKNTGHESLNAMAVGRGGRLFGKSYLKENACKIYR